MLNRLFKNKKGFTLIEVVIVLAIAGLIFVIVFLAVSQAQRSRRDTQRKNDADSYLAAAEQYASNNNGNYPTSALASSYWSRNDPTTGAAYTVTAGNSSPSATAYDAPGELATGTNTSCNGATPQTTTGARNFAVVVYQENGGSYCVDNN